MLRILFIAVLLTWTLPVSAAEIPHAFVEQTSSITTTSTSYVDITGMSISSGSFTAGKDYLIIACGQFSEDGSSLGWWQVVHGSTAFADSERSFARSSTSVDYAAQCTPIKWTAVASEGVKLQFRHNSGTQTVAMQFGSLFVMQLTDYLTENVDYVFAERTTDDSLSTTPTDGASCSVTPSTSGDWLAFTYSQLNTTDTTTRLISRMVRSGEAASSTPASSLLPETSVGFWAQDFSRTFTFGASANTIKEQSEAAASSGTRDYSMCFLLRLDAFAAHGAAYTDASQSLTSTTMTNIQTTTITPTVTGDVIVGAAFILDKTTSTGDVEFRVQVDETDQPAGQTAADLDFDQWNTTHTDNDIPISLVTMANLASGSRTVDLDANRNVDSDVKYRQVWAFTAELAASAATIRRRGVRFLP